MIAHKNEVLAALAAANSTEAANLIEQFHEHAAIREYEAGYRRDTAEALAFAEVVEAWCRRHPLLHDPAICAGCGRPLGSEALALADGARVHWERDREFSCLIGYGFAWKKRAIEALVAMGLLPPAGWGP